MKRIPNDLAEKAIIEYCNGTSSDTVGQCYSISGTEVLNLVRRAGHAVRTKAGKPKIYNEGWTERFVTAYKSGKTIVEIAKEMGAGQGTVWRALASKDIICRPNGIRKQSITIPTNPAILAYVAAMIDGGGDFQLKPQKTSTGKDSIGCRLTISNTHKGLHIWLQENIGGSVHWKRMEHPDFKPIGRWQIYRARDMVALLSAILPYMIIKKDAAETVLAFLNTKFNIWGTESTANTVVPYQETNL